MNLKTRSIVAFFVVLAASIWLVLAVRRPGELETHPAPSPADGAAAGDGPLDDSKTGSASISAIDHDACAECHADIVADYQRNGMSQTWRPAAAIVSTNRAGGAVVDQRSGYRYDAAVEDGVLWQTETRPDIPQHLLRRRAEYLVGSGKHAQAMIAVDNGYLYQMPVAWFAAQGAWRLNPGFELQNQRFNRVIPPGCVGCHTTSAVHEAPTRNRYHQPIASGIDCRRCHGAAERHVAFWRDGDGDGDEQNEQAAKMVHPGRLSAERANDLCLQCHLQGDVTLYRAGKGPLTFRPGDNLQKQRQDFTIVSERAGALSVDSHGARMLQSRCYTGSGGKLTCILCHDAHRSAADFTPEHYDSKCLTCHQPQSCSRDPGGEALSETGCTTCHMPQRASREGIHLVFTDHAIVRQRPAGDAASGMRAVLPPDSDVELVSCWPDAQPDKATLGAAYVLLHETMGPQTPSLERGRRLLSEVDKQDPEDATSRFWLASALVGLRRGDEAAPLFRSIPEDHPQRYVARLRLGVAYELTGDLPAAAAQYDKLIRDAPAWLEPYALLARLYLAKRDANRAVSVLQQRISFQPDAAAYAQLALAMRMRGDSHDAALAVIDKALQLDPRLPAAYMNRAALHLLAGDEASARADLVRVTQFDPDNQQAIQALQNLAR